MIKLKDLLEGSVTGNIKGLRGYTGFIQSNQWNSKLRSLEQSILKTTGYTMVDDVEPIDPDTIDTKDNEVNTGKVDDKNIASTSQHKKLEKIFKKQISEKSTLIKMKPLISERVDYHESATALVKSYGLKSKVKIGTGKQFGEYIPETDTIALRPSYKSAKAFLMTVLHEIKHALDAKRLGVKKYIKKYTQAGTMANYDGLDPHDDNKWEEKAENFAKQELHKWL